MPYPQWKGESNNAVRRRIEQIRWHPRDKVSVAFVSILVVLVALISGWLASVYRE
jgi:hypothetical protein